MDLLGAQVTRGLSAQALVGGGGGDALQPEPRQAMLSVTHRVCSTGLLPLLFLSGGSKPRSPEALGPAGRQAQTARKEREPGHSTQPGPSTDTGHGQGQRAQGEG